MHSIQFDPKIATDVQIDSRRPRTGQPPDLFADLLADKLKKRLDADRRESEAKRSQPSSDPLSGRPSRLTLDHPRTLRGDARRAEDGDARLTDQRHPAAVDSGAKPADEAATAEDPAADAGPTARHETAETPASAEATATEDPAAGEPAADERAADEQVADEQAADEQVADEQVADEQVTDEQVAETAAVIVVPTQSAVAAASPNPGPETLILPAPASTEGENVAPEQAQPAGKSTVADTLSDAEAAAEQQAIGAMAEAGLSEVAASLNAGEAAASTAADMPVVATQPDTTAAAQPGREPLMQTLQTSVTAADWAPRAVQQVSDRSSMDVKLRQSASPRPQAAMPNQTPNAAPAQSAPPHQTALLQPGATGAFADTSDLFEQPFSPDGSGPGWTLHLAQGAASKRADFVAQLRQHLQNLPAHEQVAVHVQRAAREGTGRLSVQLSPAELGRIHVKLDINEDKKVTASVTVERSSTLELLQRDIKGLERALHNAGLALEGGDLSFSLGRGSDQEFAQDLNHSAAPAGDGSVPGADSEGEQPADHSPQVTDTAAGVVNLQV